MKKSPFEKIRKPIAPPAKVQKDIKKEINKKKCRTSVKEE